MENRNKGRLGELVQLFENRRKNDMESGECFIKLSFPFVDEILLPILKAALPEPTHLLTPEEAATATGCGWLENWIPGDEEDGTAEPETKLLYPAAWCCGKAVNSAGEIMKLADKRFYNRKYGYRVWTGEPTDEQVDATPWLEDEAEQEPSR